MDPDQEIDLDDFIIDLTGLTRESRTRAWVKKEAQ